MIGSGDMIGDATFILMLLPMLSHFSVFAGLPDPSKFVVWGPGLNSEFNLPARYFYVQPVDSQGNNITTLETSDEAKLTAHLWKTDTRVRAYSEVLYIARPTTALFLVRFRMIRSAKDANIDVLWEGKHVAGSPYELRGHIRAEDCSCPEQTAAEWASRLACPSDYAQITADFDGRFASIDMDTAFPTIRRTLDNPEGYAYCRYKIRRNRVYRRCYGRHVGFNMFADAILLSLSRKMRLPDLDFVMNLGDWPLSDKADAVPLPILSWCGSDTSHDIVLPTYELTEATLQMMERTTVDVFNAFAKSELNWTRKTARAFWRGRDSSEERLRLVRMSLAQPDLVDARLTNMFFFPNDSSLGERVPAISMFDFAKYRYQLNLDGTVAAYRLAYLMAGASLVLKQASPYYEHFYRELAPMRHYVPVRRDLDDLEERLRWAAEHDKEARGIAEAAHDLVWRHLLPADIYCYHVRVLLAYAGRLRSRVIIDPEDEEVPQPVHSCECVANAKVAKNSDEL